MTRWAVRGTRRHPTDPFKAAYGWFTSDVMLQMVKCRYEGAPVAGTSHCSIGLLVSEVAPIGADGIGHRSLAATADDAAVDDTTQRFPYWRRLLDGARGSYHALRGSSSATRTFSGCSSVPTMTQVAELKSLTSSRHRPHGGISSKVPRPSLHIATMISGSR